MRRAKIQTEDGTILRAYLHSPGPGAHPGIVMCPGFGGVKPHIDPYAALFAEAGFAVLNFDNRGWGTSEGEPRQELNVFKQITDLRDAITFAESQPEFDSEQGFGVWGSSFSGGLAIVTAANDPRVRCVVAQIPERQWSPQCSQAVLPPSSYTRSAAEPQSTGSLAWLASLR